MGNAASVLLPLGAQLIKGNGSPAVPNSSAASLNTAGSAYDLNSNDQAAPLIQAGFSTTTLLIVGGVVLAALFLWKK